MNDKEKFCNNIKKLRESHHLTKTEMARRLKISIQTLNIIESGKLPKRLSTKIVFTIMDNFNVTPGDLFK